MILPQWFVPKRRLIKVAQERMQERHQYVRIDDEVVRCDKEILAGFQESVARFAQRHNIAVNFKKAEASDKTIMNVYTTSLTPHAIKRKNQALWYFATPEYKATAEMPQNTDDKGYLKELKNVIKQLANTEEPAQVKQKYPCRIRHENKYYKWSREN